MGIISEDLLLVNRGGKSFKVMANDTDTNLDDDDLLWVQREGVDYHIRGAEIKEGIGPSQRPPDIGVFEVSPSEPGLSRFTDESFPLTMSLVTEGTPDPGIKTFKAAVSGTLKSSELSGSISEISGPTEKISYSLRMQNGRYLYRDQYGGTGTLTFWYKSSRPGVEQTICDGVKVNPPNDEWYYLSRDNITLGQIGGNFMGYLADIKFSSSLMSFHLDFADNSSDEAVGKDVSGNNLDWKLYGEFFGATNLFETAPITELIENTENTALTPEISKYIEADSTNLAQFVWDRYREQYVGCTANTSGENVTFKWYTSPDGVAWTYVSTFSQSWSVGPTGTSMKTWTLAADQTDRANGIVVLLMSNFGTTISNAHNAWCVTYVSEDGGVNWTNKGTYNMVHDKGPIQISGDNIHWVGWPSWVNAPGHPNTGYLRSSNQGASYSFSQIYQSNSGGWSEHGSHAAGGVSEDGWCKASIWRGANGANTQGWAGVHRGGTGGLGKELPFCTTGQMRHATCDNDLNVIMQTDVGLFYTTDNFATYVRVGENILPTDYRDYECGGHRSGYWWFSDKSKECYWRVTDLEDDSTWITFYPPKWSNGCSVARKAFKPDGSGKVCLGNAAFYYQTYNAPIAKFADSTSLSQYHQLQFRIKGKDNYLLGTAYPGVDDTTLTLSSNFALPVEVGDVLYRYTPFYAMSQTVDVPTPWGETTGFGFSKRAEYTTLDPAVNTGLNWGNLNTGRASGDLPVVKPGLGLWYYEVDGEPKLWDGQILNFQDGPGNYNFGQLPFYNEVPAGYKLILAERPYTLKLKDSVNIEAFAVGDYVTEYGGNDSGYGTIDSIQFDGGHPVVTLTGGAGNWSLNSKMISPPVFKDGVTLHCKLTPEGNVTALSESDYGWQAWSPTRQDFDPYKSNIIFPPLLSTGEPPDTDFPEGTELTISVRMQNSVGEEIASKTVTPGVTALHYTTKQAENRFDVIKESLTTFEERSAENEAVVLQQLEDAGLDSAEVAAVLKAKA